MARASADIGRLRLVENFHALKFCWPWVSPVQYAHSGVSVLGMVSVKSQVVSAVGRSWQGNRPRLFTAPAAVWTPVSPELSLRHKSEREDGRVE